ncbi:MAG: hypothetical protein HFI29_10150 [Lachnospiraceae bacterium]|jgi:hypothetical protein|nr:hypothetical protein [Lachnospiraceae bacterium]
MFQGKTLYDIMAEMIRILLEETDQKFIRHFFVMSQEKRDKLNRTLSFCFPEFVDMGNSTECFHPYSISEKVIKKIENFVSNCLAQKDLFLLAGFLNKLDSCLALFVRNYTTNGEEIFGLNDNWEEQEVQLLPRCYCSWEHRNKDKTSDYSLNNLLNHFYFIDTKIFREKTGLTARHVFIREGLFTRAQERNFLRIGLTPLCDNSRLTLTFEKEERCAFQVKAVSDLEIRKANAVAVLEKAREEEVDILCYPEMLGAPEVLEGLQACLWGFPEDGKSYPSLVIAPTYWHERSNTAVVLDEIGEVICVQAKQHPYPFLKDGQEYEEDIEGDGQIHLIHCNGIGRIAIAICKDALIRDYIHQMLSILRVSLLIIPSFSTGFYDFETNLATCKAYDCNVVWVNTCCAKHISEKESLGTLGYVLKTGKRSKIKNGQYSLLEEKCPKTEGKSCKDCLYTQDMYMEYRNY